MNIPKQAFFFAAVSAALTSCTRTQTPAPSGPVEVATVTAATSTVLLTTELPGRTAPFRVAEVRPQVNGLIQKRLFTEGSEVQAGQALYQIDPAPFQAALDNAKAALGRSQASLPAAQSRANRFKDALVDKAVSQQDFDDASAALKQAQADIAFYEAMVETARINLDYAKVFSPISGRIGRSSVTDGAIVTAYQPVALATVQQLDPIYVDVPQSSTDLLRLRRSMEQGQLHRDGANSNVVDLILSDGSKYPLSGTLQFQDISVDPTTATVTLRMVFPNPNGVLLPGMFVRAVVKEGVNTNAIEIPQQTVSRDPKGNPFVYVIGAESKAEIRPLTLDRAMGDQWLVASGIAPGDRLVAEGLQQIRPGSQVKEVPFAASKKTEAQPEPKAKAASPTTH
jgi:membrane fusion protein (multidrug efflux system)